MSNIVSSAIFCARNFDKTESKLQDDKTSVAASRFLIAAGQGKKVLDYVRTLDNEIGHGANGAVDAVKAVGKDNKLFKYGVEAIDFASKKINPLIIASSGLDVLTSDDKDSTLITNAGALSAMFATEDLMKKHMDKIPKMKYIKPIAEKIMKFAAKHGMEARLPAAVHGVAFVVGSCAAYSMGEKFGSLVAKKVKEDK